ncbi:MAG: SDR family oxidoreductase [Caldilineaceae bacterium]|nr:SDR family oxidoreductase [Caldilineaceae bacterium]
MIETGLAGKTVLITGANNPQGIGAATASAFARQGARVFITYLRLDPQAYGVSQDEATQAATPGMPRYHGLRTHTADAVAQQIADAGGRAATLEIDLTDPALIPHLFDQVEKRFGPVDVLVNNASHYEDPDTIFTTTVGAIDRTFAVNVRATMLLIAEFVRRYQQRGGQWGRIVNLSTDAAQTFAGQITYGASKATVEALTRSIAIEVGLLGITVNTVAPGPVQTGSIAPEVEARELPGIPLGRLGQPEDIADVIVFLASEQARWMTGNVLKVSGGHEL